MAKQYWALLDIQQTAIAGGFQIVLTTDVPCHLFMRWTTTIPQQHSIPVYRRGLAMHADKYFCFDAYKDNEQEEANDTTTHTFIKVDWPTCETRYFYFHGTISGEPSPSTTAIFKKHRVYVPPTICPFVRSIEAGNNDCGKRYRWYPSARWLFSTLGVYCFVGRYQVGSNYYRQGGMGLRYLDIPLPPGQPIHSATLTVTANGTWPGEGVNSKIRGELAPDPSHFTDLTDFNARPRTVSETPWDNIEHFLANEEYTSPDFSEVIQEIIDQPGWAPGNPLVIFWDDFDNRTVGGYTLCRHTFFYETSLPNVVRLNIDC